MKGAVQANAGEHHFGNRTFDEFAFPQLGDDLLAGVAEFEGVEGGTLRGGFVRAGAFFAGSFGDGVVGAEPFLVVGVKLGDGKGEDASFASEGDQFAIVRDVAGLECFIAGGAFPGSGGEEGRGGKKENEEQEAHGDSRG